MTARVRETELLGHPHPRIAPPIPARTKVDELEKTAKSIKMTFIPWQLIFGRYVYAIDPDDLWLYPEIAGIVSRQQGKSEFLFPHILTRLGMGRRIMHAAQKRDLPRKLFVRLAVAVERKYPKAKVRRGAGQETIELPNGGFYTIVAATGGAPRGESIDDLLLDELRELDEDFVGAAQPTLTASLNPQTLYLSNAGAEHSRALNSVRARSGEDRALAYLEWSAAPERAADDILGWQEANPALGHFPGVIKTLERAYNSAKLAGTLAYFETEHLCRWVTTMRERLVDDYSWVRCQGEIGKPVRPMLGVSMDPKGQRASVCLAWREGEGVAMKILLNVVGDPIDTDALGEQVKKLATKLGVQKIGFDPLTDAELVKYLKKTEAVNGQKYANASAQFVNIVQAGKLRWQDADAVTDDLTWTSRKPDGEAGSYHAVRAQDDRPITASLAAIRAVWLASGPEPAKAKVM